jgi:tetratricopeptide (TPR) repeat protein
MALRRVYLTLTLLLSAIITSNLQAQNKNIDSLLILIKTDKADTVKVNHLDKLYWEYKKIGLYDSALKCANQELLLSQQLNIKKMIANSYNNIGIIYKHQDNYPIAIDYYFKALEIADELKDESREAIFLGNIGVIYGMQNNFSKANEYFFKALKMAEKSTDKNQVAVHLGNIGNVYIMQKKYSNALDYYFMALKTTSELKDKNKTSMHLANIGIVYLEQKNYSQALDYNFKALKMSEELKNKNAIATSLGNIGTIYLATKKFTEAKEYLQKALAISDSMGTLSLKMSNLFGLSELYENTGEPIKALSYYKRAIIIKDSIFNQDKNKEITRHEMNYEFEKRETATKATTEKQQALAEERSRKQKIIIWAIAGGLLLVLVFAGFIFYTLQITRKQKQTIEHQKQIVDVKQNEIVASITYAKRIQTALLTSDEYITKHLPAEYFVLFKPKGIVSGDFYWALSIPALPGWDMGTNKVKLTPNGKRQNTFYMMTADCTGHGVPGAFMSMLNMLYLNENVIERGIRLPHDILNSQRREIIEALNPPGSTEESKDGMDCSLCVYDFNKMLLHFAAANNALWLIRNGELTEYKADKMPVGKYGEKMAPFTLQTIFIEKGDIVYTSTDGYADQFGVSGKKLMKKRFKEELLKIHHLPMNEQKEYLASFFESWKGTNEQVDDVCVIGVRI